MVIKILLVLLAFQVCAALPGNFTWSDKDGLNYMGINQNQNLPYRCESGWAFATVNALNPRLKIRMNKTNFPSPTVSLSVQVLLECDTFDFGCLGVIYYAKAGRAQFRHQVDPKKQPHRRKLQLLQSQRIYQRPHLHLQKQMRIMHRQTFLQGATQLQNL